MTISICQIENSPAPQMRGNYSKTLLFLISATSSTMTFATESTAACTIVTFVDYVAQEESILIGLPQETRKFAHRDKSNRMAQV